ncbi:MAG: basic amino acid/polyamine antiporter, family [Gammaproteobacteria bacterium]|jgi:APA family basic amino acid/polyamine antiporter|nr:basic amino acid/polyamine antiporter, family [Gammaproteobacteria bacterium]
MCTALVIGNVIGVGIFVLPASLAPYGLNALTGWLITVVGCAFLAISLSTLSRAFPNDDGPYSYTKRAFGDGVAFTVMWCYWFSTWVTNATIAVGIVGYLTVFFPGLSASAWLPPVTALSLLWFFVLINLGGARAVGWVQIMTTALKLVPLLGVICLGLWVLFTNPAAYTQHTPRSPATFGALSSVSTLTLFAMLGIECAMIPAGRVRDPSRTIPRATVIGTIVTAVIYIGVSVVPMLLIPQAALAASNAPFADLFARILGDRSSQVLAIFVVIGGLGALNGWTLIVAEVTQSIARHGAFPHFLSKENKHGAPTFALVVTGAIASVMLLSNYSQSIAGMFTKLSVIVTAGNLPFYFACSLAVVIGARRFPGVSPQRATFLIAASLGAALYCMWATIGIGIEPLLWALALAAAGVPVYVICRYQAVVPPSMAKSAPVTQVDSSEAR